ncbi:MAG: UPF0721 transmembrane protein [Melioribacteraceae bacterium]|nr:MAG: UPF0721 transmembrane protein [Melioribacteraceae bacterium]
MEILGYIAAIIIGVTLGLIGGGGSILTVPVLVYLLQIEPVHATAYSLFIVGTTSLFGTASYMKKGLVSYKTAIIFAIPAFIAVFATRKFIIPAIPDLIFTMGDFELTKGLFLMLVFALLMVVASISMIKGRKGENEESEISFNYPMIFLEGIIVGVLTGLVGAGGGFLIIPALVLLAKLPMKLAVGTSLLIIAAKSLLGFLGDVSEMHIEWIFLIKFSVFTVGGIFLGSYLSKFIEGKKLKPAFGWFVLIMGIYIIGKELYTSL